MITGTPGEIFNTAFTLSGIDFRVSSTARGITAILLNPQDKLPHNLHMLPAKSKQFFGLYEQLTEYMRGKRTTFDLPLALTGTEFQLRVWKQLTKIPYGKVVSYKDVATGIKNPGAVRAVGSANGANPVPIVVPCHRVISADGSIGGYSGGLDIKRLLLSVEGIQI